MLALEKVAREVLKEGLDDWVPIDTLLWYAREEGAASGEDFRGIARDSLKLLLSSGLAMVGDLGETGFEAWQGDVYSLVGRAVACCEEFDWNPHGAACWISNTSDGSSLMGAELDE